jgi:hypothetical protein
MTDPTSPEPGGLGRWWAQSDHDGPDLARARGVGSVVGPNNSRQRSLGTLAIPLVHLYHYGRDLV